MKAGLWGARGDGGGLGALTWEWYRHLQPERTMGIDLGERGRGPTVRSRFPDAEWQQGMDHDIPEEAVRRFMQGLDVVFMAETGYRDDVCHIARQEGCATVLMEMPEMHRADHAPPDRVWAPTDWRLDALAPEAQIVPVPVARDRLPYQYRTEVSTWLHVAAPAMLDRNGTRLVLGALAHVRTPCRVILAGHGTSASNVGVVTVETRAEPTVDYWDAYSDEVDALLLPRRYGGLSLPLEEAASRGMPIVTLDLAPQDQWVPPAGLVPAWEWRQIRMPGGTFAVHTADPRQVAAAMDRVMRPEVASACSAAVGEHAAAVAWSDWAGRYRTLMADVLGSRC